MIVSQKRDRQKEFIAFRNFLFIGQNSIIFLELVLDFLVLQNNLPPFSYGVSLALGYPKETLLG